MESFLNDEDDIAIGMQVRNEDEAYQLYCQHAARKGFDVRKSNVRYDGKRVIRQQDYVCSNSGVYHDGDPCETKKVSRLVKRTDCKAFIRFTITDGVWEVTHFNNTHNHNFVAPEDRQFMKINRHINDASASVISSMVDAGIGGTKTYSYLSKEVGGPEYVGFTKQDCQNFISRRKMNLIEKGDAQTILTQFKHRLLDDPMFYHAEELDEDGRLANFFWRGARSKLDYDCFGDVVVFDTTYRTNKYNMIFAPFVGINHHKKNIFFACAFLLNETTETFVWLFETFLEAMGNKAPKAIFTDQCQAMANAIKTVFPNTCHRLCSWHISKNATQRLGGLYSNIEFKKLFSKCLYGCETEAEFELTWGKMVKDFDLADNRWLKMNYEVREKWCPAFTSLTVHPTQISHDGPLYTYSVIEEACNRCRTVEFNSATRSIMCSCKMFESRGWLCRHALKILNAWSITELPSEYILTRWTKQEKQENVVQEAEESSRRKKYSLTIQRNHLVQLAYRAISHLVMTDEGHKVATLKVGELWEESKRNMDTCNQDTSSDKEVIIDTFPVDGEVVVLDPPCVREKGVTNARIKSCLEKKRKRKGGQKFSFNIGAEQDEAPNDLSTLQPPLHFHGMPMLANNQDSNRSDQSLGDRAFNFTSMLHCDDQELDYLSMNMMGNDLNGQFLLSNGSSSWPISLDSPMNDSVNE